MTSGLSCDGDSVAMTAATNPSLEDLLTRRRCPACRRIVDLQPAARLRDRRGLRAALRTTPPTGALDPFILVLEGSVPNEEINGEGHWAGLRRRPGDRAADPDHARWIDRLAPQAGGGAGARHVRRLRRHPGDAQQPDRRDGPARLPRRRLASRLRPAGREPARLPGAARQHHRDAAAPRAAPRAASAPPLDLDEQGRPGWLFGRTVHEGCDRAGFAEQRRVRRRRPATARCLVKLGCSGPVVKCNVPVRGWVNGVGGCPNVGGICMACTMPGFPDKYMPFMDADRLGLLAAPRRAVHVRPGAPVPPPARDRAHVRRRAGVAQAVAELTTGYAKRW